MSVRQLFILAVTLTAFIYVTNAPAHSRPEPGIECGHVRDIHDAKRVAKRAWSKPYGPSKKDKQIWLRIKQCARTNYQREVRFPHLWVKYKKQLSEDRSLLRLEKSCDQSPTHAVVGCIKYASQIHNYSLGILMGIALCESHLNPYAHNPSGASGLFQFMPGTFASTPYAGQSIYSAKYNALAAAWYMANHGTSAWECA